MRAVPGAWGPPAGQREAQTDVGRGGCSLPAGCWWEEPSPCTALGREPLRPTSEGLELKTP